jgi:hypothetical protein
MKTDPLLLAFALIRPNQELNTVASTEEAWVAGVTKYLRADIGLSCRAMSPATS